MNNKTAKKVVIVAVLNWGLGHATRCVPLIKALQAGGFTPILASDGMALHYLQNQFPNLKTHTLTSYRINYKGRNFLLNMLLQLPQIAKAAFYEKKEIKLMVEHYKAVGVISDNRLGARSEHVLSVYITHQLNLKAGVFSAVARWAHRRYIQRFHVCIIPDFEEKNQSLAGSLSHDFKLKALTHYTGPLSRFSVLPKNESVENELKINADKQHLACIILSGPEPARTVWESEIIQQVKALPKHSFLIIRGSETKLKHEVPTNVKLLNLATADEVFTGIKSAEVVVSRSGYSSLMDYAYLQNKALLVPTMGQSEQEYLAKRHSKIFATQSQKEFNLLAGIEEAKTKKGFEKNTENSSAGWELLFALFEGK